MPRCSRVLWTVAFLLSGFGASNHAQAPDSLDKGWLGTWTLNVEKSTFTPGPGPTQETRTHEDAGDGFMLILQETVDVQGIRTRKAFREKVNGKSHPVATQNQKGYATATSEISLVAVNPYTVTFMEQQNQNVWTTTGTRVLSRDGQTMTITSVRVDFATRDAATARSVYEKR